MKKVFPYLLIMLWLSTNILRGQDLNPPIQNFTLGVYSAASQNWDIEVGDDGIIYAANHQGLLSYDGQKWKLHSLKSGAIIRSVYPKGKRIYTGSYKEFGFWERDNKGELNYTSLMPLYKENSLQSEEFWQILSYKNEIYFRSFGAIYKYDGHIIEKIKDIVTNEISVYNGRLVVSVSKQGLFYLEPDGQLTVIPGQALLQDKTVINVEQVGEILMVGTRNALYTFDGEKFTLFEDKELIDLLNRYELNHILNMNDEYILFGTVKNGVISYSRYDGSKQIYNRISGLQNNTVLGMASRKGKIWLALDNGIDVINLTSPVRFYTDESGELGAVYDIAAFNSKLYLASNTGVYELDSLGLKIIEGAEGHCWNLEIINDKLYSNHNTGTYKIENGKFIPIDLRTGSFDIIKLPAETGKILIGTYTGISLYDTVTGVVNEIDNVDFPVNNIIFENQEILWGTHPYEGVYRLGLSDDYENANFLHKVAAMDGKDYRTEVVKINNQIAVYQNEVWYRYNSFKDNLEKFNELENFNNHRLLLADRTTYWLTNTANNSLLYTDFKDLKMHLSLKELSNRIVKGNENVVKLTDSVYLVTLIDGFARIDLTDLLKAGRDEPPAIPVVTSFENKNRKYALTSSPSIPYNEAGELRLGIGLPDGNGETLVYHLEGSTDLEGIVENGEIIFQNLSHGDYSLSLYNISSQGERSEVFKFGFSIDPPWYLSRLMAFIYILFAFAVAGAVYLYNKRKLRRHQLVLEQKLNKEHQERLSKLEKERLITEITNKRKELANSTMMAVKKNEVLMEIQGELTKDKEKFSNQFRLKHIMTKINQAIKNRDEMKIFEVNFNELHEDFFRVLLEKYPQLGNKDLKLCAYLKMNLSSKEIAPLMGISLRGVEVHRYRLRKKMNLDPQENLTNFLIKNF